MKIFTPEEWMKQARDIHVLIMQEIKRTTPEILPEQYPKLVVMYEFFRFLRGEAFLEFRTPVGDDQKELYNRENEIVDRLKEFEKQLSVEDKRTAYHLDVMKKSFSLKYFNQA